VCNSVVRMGVFIYCEPHATAVTRVTEGRLVSATLQIVSLYINGSNCKLYATSRKVAGSSPDEVDFFNLLNPSSRTMALGSTQSLTEISTRDLPGG
jgi:hypothetical protein